MSIFRYLVRLASLAGLVLPAGSVSLGQAPEPVTRRVTIDHPLVIRAPRIGFLNLVGSSADEIVKADRKALGPLFSSVEEANDKAPVCDVLMVYAKVKADGQLEGRFSELGDVIAASRAAIVILASDNSGDAYIAASKRKGLTPMPVNLIMTLHRKDDKFASFFSKLFERMYKGQSMLMAWVELAPQDPRAPEQNDGPAVILVAGITHIIFERAPQSPSAHQTGAK
jgi:hypothetical protein